MGDRLAGLESHRGLDVHADRRDRAACADGLDGLGERRLVADALEDHVGAAPIGERADLLGRIGCVHVDRLGPELGGERQTIVHAVHREHAGRAEELGRLHGEQSHRAGAEHGHHVARTDPTVLGAAVRGREDVAEEERVVVRHRRRDPLAQVVGERHADALGLATREHRPEAAAHALERHRLHRVPPSRMSRLAPRLVSYTTRAAAPRMLSALSPGTMRTRVASSDRRNAWAAAASRTFFSSAA